MTPERMPLEMSQQSRKEVLEKMKQRYARRPGREARGRLLDEVCELCGYERKHALKVLGGRVPIAGGKSRRGGPRRRYGEEEKAVLKAIWLAAEQPCGKRLKAAVPLWLPHYEKRQCKLEAAVRERLLKMSAATMDRMLKAVKIQLASRGRCGTRPGTLLRTQIASALRRCPSGKGSALWLSRSARLPCAPNIGTWKSPATSRPTPCPTAGKA